MTDKYVYKGVRRLRCGYTTGSCAAAAAGAAAVMLLSGKAVWEASLTVPEGTTLLLPVTDVRREESFCSCAVRKDSGDDPDVTDQVLVYASVSPRQDGQLILTGGRGVGRVTKPGLSVPVGEAAINPVPRKMILEEVRRACEAHSWTGGMNVEISVPEGELLAKRTFNPKLGIEGGISILGTTGIVEPMSEEALIRTIELETRMAVKNGNGYVLMVPGNYGETFVRQQHLAERAVPVKCSNYVGESLDAAARAEAKGVLYVAHIGKFVKLAEGMMNTHSAYGDGRMAILCAHTVRAGGSLAAARAVLDSATTDEALRVIKEAGLLEPVMEGLMGRIEEHLERRAGGSFAVGAVVFSNVYGILGQTGKAGELLERLNEQV